MIHPAKNFLLGIMTITGALGFVGLLFSFGELDPLIRQRYTLTINTNHAAGLRAGSTIELNGVPIGVVEEVMTRRNVRFPVQVVALIKSGEQIPKNVVPFATTSLLGGGATLQLEGTLSDPARAEFLAVDGSATIESVIGSRLIEQVRSELDSLVTPLVELANNLNRLLEQPDPADPDAVAASLHTTISNVNTALRKYTELASAVESEIHGIATRVVPAMEQFEATAVELERLARLAREGEGTLGRLLNDPSLYLSLTETAELLDELIIEVRLLIEKIEKEGLRTIY